MKPKFFLVCGMSGSGKTTFAKTFCEKNHCTYLSPDIYYELMGLEDRNHSNKFKVWIALFKAIRLAEMEQRDVLVDTNALTYVDRAQFLKWFPEFEHHLIYIHTTFGNCITNNRMRERKIPLEIMTKMWDKLEPPNEKEIQQWDTFTCIKNTYNNFSFDGIFIKKEENNDCN